MAEHHPLNTVRRLNGNWLGIRDIPPADYECGFCGNQMATTRGATFQGHADTFIAICIRCNRPTFFEAGRRVPASTPGRPIQGIPADVAQLYDEARKAAGAGAYTSSVMASRKILMNVAVSEGADEGLRFVEYVDYLEAQHFFSPKMRTYVDYIRRLGNEANHEIAPKTEQDATAAIEFVASLLRHNYEVPGLLPVPKSG